MRRARRDHRRLRGLALRLEANGSDGACRHFRIHAARRRRSAGHGQDGADQRQSNGMPPTHAGHAPHEVRIARPLVNARRCRRFAGVARAATPSARRAHDSGRLTAALRLLNGVASEVNP
jgi:hypothetical protein